MPNKDQRVNFLNDLFPFKSKKVNSRFMKLRNMLICAHNKVLKNSQCITSSLFKNKYCECVRI